MSSWTKASTSSPSASAWHKSAAPLSSVAFASEDARPFCRAGWAGGCQFIELPRSIHCVALSYPLNRVALSIDWRAFIHWAARLNPLNIARQWIDRPQPISGSPFDRTRPY